MRVLQMLQDEDPQSKGLAVCGKLEKSFMYNL